MTKNMASGLFRNIRLSWRVSRDTNTLAYLSGKSIKVKKRFNKLRQSRMWQCGLVLGIIWALKGLRLIYIGEACTRKHQSYHDAILPSLLALATLIDVIQLGMILSVSRRPRVPRQVQSLVAVTVVILPTLANVKTALMLS
jgi:hypothetical protein